ncbi:Glycerophosphoryl diester phosphodiesterase family-domain-containing protein [Phyllosticta citribraziliensis]|uniref:Glycerophosphoryl diester phosphodiesterase family-domain-containing protein n=1 Tax=Phyllosticta citribraziliensis TaxID=989973 RepID=A0ABR1L3W0_9PEZI
MVNIDTPHRQPNSNAFTPKDQSTGPSIPSDPERTVEIKVSSNPSDASTSRVVEITPTLLQQLDIPLSPERFQNAVQGKSARIPGVRDLFRLAIHCGAWKCANFLLESGFVAKIPEEDCLEGSCEHRDDQGEYCENKVWDQEEHLHSLLQVICEGPTPLGGSKDSRQSVYQVIEEETHLFHQLLQHVGPRGQHFLQNPDEMVGRLPLHSCSESGSFEMCSLMEKFSQGYEKGSSAAFAKLIMTKDFEGFTPLQLAVISGHVEIVQLYISILKEQASADQSTFRSILSSILLQAVHLQNDAMFHFIATKDVDITHQSSYNGETALHVAARLGREDYVRELLKIARRQIVCIDRPDSVREWTPLFVASANGNLPLIELFIQAGADKTRTDHAGWTAQEHAAYRGHLVVADKLRPSEAIETPKLLHSVVPEAQKVDLPPDSAVFVLTLGPMQQNRRAVDKDFEMLQQKFTDAALSIEILSSSKSHIFRYPFLDDIASHTMSFSSRDPDRAYVEFRLWGATSTNGTKGVLLGSGAATLHEDRSCFGSQRESLIREHSVNMLSNFTMSFIGSISFTYVRIDPFPGLSAPTPSHAWDSVQIHGHRGNGQNHGNEKYLQLGENTIGSFLSAAKHGATHVEVYVQVTRDLVPVLFHDFSLSESGTDIPIHDLTYQQFMYASNVQSPRGDPLSMLGKVQSPHETPPLARSRARSLTGDEEKGAKEVQDRMQFTVDYQAKGFKPNTRGHFIQDTFATLEEALLEVPEDVGFNIEIKYPRIHEALGAGVSPISHDLNTFIDTILATIERCTSSSSTPSPRPIVLTSFTPEVCILLAHKQRAFPILFITNGGKQPVEDHDVRAQSVRSAVRFARQWGLDGVVFAADVFGICPGLIRRVKSKGLRCGSYGGANGDVEAVEKQVRAGIDVLITDRVGLVREVVERVGAEGGRG